MILLRKHPGSISAWVYRFAILPRRLGNYWIWFEHYAYRLVKFESSTDGAYEWIYQWSSPRTGAFQRAEYGFAGATRVIKGVWKPVLCPVETVEEKEG